MNPGTGIQSTRMPLVTVLLPVRDGARTLALAMLSVLEQSFRDFELLLLDDGSTDATPRIALGFDDAGRARALRPSRSAHAALCAQPWNGFYIAHPSWMGRTDWFRRHRYRTPELARAQDQELLLRAYPHSRFAVLEDILLGYRAGSASLRKVWSARRHLLAAQVGCFAQRRQWNHLALAALATGAKLPLDLLYATAPGRRWQAHRRAPVPPEVEKAWNQLMQTLTRRLDRLRLPGDGASTNLADAGTHAH